MILQILGLPIVQFCLARKTIISDRETASRFIAITGRRDNQVMKSLVRKLYSMVLNITRDKRNYKVKKERLEMGEREGNKVL